MFTDTGMLVSQHTLRVLWVCCTCRVWYSTRGTTHPNTPNTHNAIYIYIYVHRERERDVYIYIYIHIYIYIYI